MVSEQSQCTPSASALASVFAVDFCAHVLSNCRAFMRHLSLDCGLEGLLLILQHI